MIDTHTHAATNWTQETVAQGLEMTGAERIVLAAVPTDHWNCDMNEGCAKLIELFPDKVVGLIGIHPPNVDQSLRDIETYAKRGFIGVKLMPTSGYYPDDEKLRRVFEEVNARKMLVLSHCGWCSPSKKEKDLPQCTLFSHPYHLEPLIRCFPDTDFIMAHGGGRTMFHSAFELTMYHKNAWVDLCPGQGTWALQHAGVWLNILDWDRVLFGSDSVYGNMESVQHCRGTQDLVVSLLRLTGFKEKTEAVLGDNARRLLMNHGVTL